MPQRAGRAARGVGAGAGRGPRRVPRRALEGALVVERVRFRAGTGREVLAAFRHDPAFGPVVVLGVGGLDTEALLGALRPEKARAMLAARGLTAERARCARCAGRSSTRRSPAGSARAAARGSRRSGWPSWP